MILISDSLPVLSKFRKYLLIISIVVLAAVEVIASGRDNINIFSESINVWQLLVAVCVLIILYILISYYIKSDKQESVRLQEPLVIKHEVQKEYTEEVKREEVKPVIEPPVQKEPEYNTPVFQKETEKKENPENETVHTLVHGFTNELKLNNEQAEADVLKYFIEKIEKTTDEFSIVIYGSGNRQLYMGLDAISIHLDRIANFYNDHDQFKGELTRYDAQLFHMIEFSDSTIRRIETFRPENKYLKGQLCEVLKLAYANKLIPVFEKYEQMVSKVENKNAKRILQTVMDKITETKFSMEMLEKSVY
jgi:hypothetical protein